MSELESCKCCGRMTTRGQQQYRESRPSIYGVDLTKPISENLTEIRNALTKLRGQLHDIGFRWSGFEQRLEAVQGLMTCGIVVLYHDIEEVKDWEKRYADKAVVPVPENAGT